MGFKDWFQVEELMPWIRARLNKLVANPSDREEIAGNIFVVLARALKEPDIRPQDPKVLYGWLNQVVKNQVSHYFKKKRPVLMPDDSPILANVGKDADPHPMEFEYIKRAVDELPDYMRQVIIMYYFDDKPFGQIAQELGIPLSTAKRRAFDGREKLRGVLQKYQ